MDNRIADDTREPYEPPTVEDVPLRAGEQVLGGCKHPTGPSPGRGGGFFGCKDRFNTPCVGITSS